AVNRNHAELIALRVEEDQFRWRLYDLRRRPHPRNAARLAVELGILLRAVAIEVLDTVPEFRPVHRNFRTHPLRDARIALEVDARRTRTGIALRLRARPPALQQGEIALLVGLRGAATPAATAPHTGEIGMAVGRARRRNILLGSLRAALRSHRNDGHRRRN